MSVRTALTYATLLVAALAASAAGVHAQAPTELGTPKRVPLPSVLRPACSTATANVAAPTDAKRRQARDAASVAQQAAILGDTAAALTRLRLARSLDPTDADVAYQLARVYESAGSSDSATTEYCRFLTLAPNAADAADARARLTVLAKPTPDPVVESANANFRAGLAAYDAGRMVDAESRFGKAVEAQPTWADAYFDRALARLAQGDREQAAGDLELYLRINPAAADRDKVTAQIGELRHTQLSPTQAFSMGLFIPGAGQFYTHRPGRGALLLLAAGGAVTYGMMPEHKTTTSQETATDPFGNPYTYTATHQETNRPYLVPGLVFAGGIAILGAVEAATFANKLNNPAQRVSFIVLPSRGMLAARIAF